MFTPEPVMGTVRFIYVLYKLTFNINKWIPSKKIEDDIKKKGLIKMSLYNYSLYSIVSILIIYYFEINFIIIIFLSFIILLPIFSIITSFNTINGKISIRKKKIKNIKIHNKIKNII